MVIPYFHIYGLTVGMMLRHLAGRAADPDSEVRRRDGAGGAARLPADLLPRRADDLRVAAESSAAARVQPRSRLHLQQRIGADCDGGAREVRADRERAAQPGLRPVGSLAGDAFDAAPGQAEARQHRAADARHRHEDRRPRNRHARTAARRGRRAVRGGPAGDEGLLEPARRDRDRAAHRRRRRGVAAHRRRGAHRRGRLHLHRAAQEGHDHRRRLQRVSVRGRRRRCMRIRR